MYAYEDDDGFNDPHEIKVFCAETQAGCVQQAALYLNDEGLIDIVDHAQFRESFIPGEVLREAAEEALVHIRLPTDLQKFIDDRVQRWLKPVQDIWLTVEHKSQIATV